MKLCRCKNCGKHFNFTGQISDKYCSRKGHIYKDVGAAKTWTASKSGDKAFNAYRREHKKRFVSIKVGRLTQKDFYVWRKKGREKKAKCDSRKITLEEFPEWLERP